MLVQAAIGETVDLLDFLKLEISTSFNGVESLNNF
jgi:hypothetical protein